MAVYYKWIKGCAPGSSLTSGLWTYIKWAEGTAGTDAANNLPHICTYTRKTDNPTTENDLGYFLTNKATGIQIEKDWIFNNGVKLYFGDRGSFYSDSTNFYLSFKNEFYIKNTTDGDYIRTYKMNDIKTTVITSSVWIGSYDSWSAQFPINSSSPINFYSSINISSEASGTQSYASIYTKGSIYAEKQCEASYFNARSDARAKENIQPATYSALDIIKQLPIYNYNYKNNPNERMTGILAQDLLKVQPENLDLVSNKNATGIDGDYMSIKNDKLMFVLMKAIQEQQEEIQALKEEIKNLRK